MPNGGIDCCGNCNYNRAVRELGKEPVEDREQFWERSFCMLRDVNITSPFSTYCASFSDKETEPFAPADAEPRGPIWTRSLVHYQLRIPWNIHNEPRIHVSATCLICGSRTAEGIEVEHDGATLGFCSDRHYVTWWKLIHEDDRADPRAYGYEDGDW